MRPPWMDPDEPGPTALCVTSTAAREAHRWASDVPGRNNAPQVQAAYDEARTWCKACPVVEECLEWALTWEVGDSHGRDGVYGARTPVERAELARRAPRASAASKPRPCSYCGDVFAPGSPAAQYCGDRCRRSGAYRQQNERRRNERARARAGRAA